MLDGLRASGFGLPASSMILTLAFRSLLAHPVRTAFLAGGFGLGVAVMAILLGVGEVVLVQAQSPQLVGGGDVLVTGSQGQITAARVLLAGTLRSAPLAGQVRVAAPWSRAMIYLWPQSGSKSDPPRGTVFRVRARGGIPSLERALDDSETADQPGWVDTAADRAWAAPDPGDVLRTVDRFHPIPDAPSYADSWAEWLYFNGRAAGARFYLTFLVGPRDPSGKRSAGVRLQLDRDRGVESFHATTLLEDAAVARAPDLTIGASSVRLDGLRYRIHLDLTRSVSEKGLHAPSRPAAPAQFPRLLRAAPVAARRLGVRQALLGRTPSERDKRRLVGDLEIEAAPGRLVAPFEIHGAGGWRTGYVVPVISGTLDGSLRAGDDHVDFSKGTAYHDHNWGFWRNVTWQWGQVQHDGLSLVYGRVFPPRDAADPDRMPGVLAVVGPSGPIGYTTNLTIEETNDRAGKPVSIAVTGRSSSLEVTMRLDIESAVSNPMRSGPLGAGMTFMQLRGTYQVSGRAGEHHLGFRAQGSAETFRLAMNRRM